MLPKHWFELTYENSGSAIIAEFDKKYRDCYVWLKETENAIPKLVKYIGNNQGERFSFLYKDQEIFCHLDTSTEILVDFPKHGGFTHQNNYCFFVRIPARQHRLAPNHHNCRAYIPNINIHSFSHGLIGIDEACLLDAFSKNYQDWGVCLSRVLGGTQLGAALSNKFGITIGSVAPMLWYQQYPIGYIMGEKVLLKVPSMRQELEDFFRINRLGVEIEDQ